MAHNDSLPDHEQARSPLRQLITPDSAREFLEATLDALPAHSAILDRAGRVVLVNRAWRRFGELNGNRDLLFGIGANYLDVCDTAQGEGAEIARAVARGLRRVLEGRAQSFVVRLPAASAACGA